MQSQAIQQLAELVRQLPAQSAGQLEPALQQIVKIFDEQHNEISELRGNLADLKTWWENSQS